MVAVFRKVVFTQIWAFRLKLLFSSNWNFATILLHFLYIFLILNFFSGFWNCSLNSKMADPNGVHFQICDVIVAFCDVMIDTLIRFGRFALNEYFWRYI